MRSSAPAIPRLRFPRSAPLLLLASALVAALGGCSTQIVLPDRPLLECADASALCQPGRFSEVRTDTATVANGYHLSIDRVEGLNGEANEFGVSFPTGTTARANGYATVRESARDGIITVAFSSYDRAYPLVRMEDRNDGSSVGGGASLGGKDTLYFTARRPGTLRGDYDLFQGLATDAGIDAPRRMPQSTRRFWEAQPALSPDGRELFFASDRPGGLGGVDLYVSRRNASGRWGAPVNLGPGVNTPCDELTPFVSGDGRWLYFSSSGHRTVGGYDIFRAPLSRGEVGRAENLGMPINTVADEIFPGAPASANPDTLLYYGSNQEGSLLFDVYVLHPAGARRTTASETKRLEAERIRLRGTVRDAGGRPVDSALVRLEQRDPPGPADSTITRGGGRYEFPIDEGKRYGVIAGSDRSLYGRGEVLVPRSNTEKTVTLDVSLPDTVTFRINFPFNNATDPYEFTLDDRGLPSDDRWTDIVDNAARFLARLRPEEGHRVTIVGHTDPVGSDAFNLGLGRRRAEFVRRELVARGVSPALLSVESEGELRALTRSASEPEELYHARLRRVELVRAQK
jgi:hypothetical protein